MSESKEVKAAAQQHHPFLYTLNPYQQQHHHQQQMQKLHQQMKQQGRLLTTAADKPEETTSRSSGTLLTSISQSTPPHCDPPVAAPREDRRTSPKCKPRKQSRHCSDKQIAPADETLIIRSRQSKRQADQSERNGRNYVSLHNSEETLIKLSAGATALGHYAAQPTAAKPRKNIVKERQLKPCNPDKDGKDSEKSCRTEKVKQAEKLKDFEGAQVYSSSEKSVQAQCSTSPKPDFEPAKTEQMCKTVIDQNEILSGGTSLSSFRGKLPSDSGPSSERESLRSECDTKGLDTENDGDASLKKESQVVPKSSDNHNCGKRTKTIRKTEPAGKDKSETDESTKPQRCLQADMLHNLAANGNIDDEDESQRAENSGEKPPGVLEENFRSSANGKGACDRSAVSEAGRRLAKLRKRLEDSLEQIQRQPGLDKELIEKACSARMRQRQDDLENVMNANNDITGQDSLCINGNGLNQIEADVSKLLKPPVSLKPAQDSGTENCQRRQQLHPALDISEQGIQDAADGEPSQPAGKTTPELFSCLGADASTTRFEKQISIATQLGAQTSDTINEQIHSDEISRPTSDLQGKPPLDIERATLPNNIPTVYQGHDKTNDTLREAAADLSATLIGKGSESTAVESGENQPSRDSNAVSSETLNDEFEKSKKKAAPVVFLSSKGKVLDEEGLEVLLERQSKRREDLKQRKRNRIDKRMESERETATNVTCEPANHDANQASTLKETLVQQSLEHTIATSVCQINTPDRDGVTDGDRKTDTKNALLFPVKTQLNCVLLEAAPTAFGQAESTETHALGKPSEKWSSPTHLEHPSPYVSVRNVSHLKHPDPLTEQSKHRPSRDERSCLEKRPGLLDGELILGNERESSVRRRVRWRRQAERSEKQRAEDTIQKTPPPVPPKVTRLMDIVAVNVDSQERLVSPDNQNRLQQKVSSDDTLHGLASRVGNFPVTEKQPYHHRDASPPKLVPSPRLIRGSFICTIRDKNAALAAGETGLTKNIPDNVEICEEKSLSPSKAASVFDPKAQEERDKEKQDAERAMRANNREGMSSPQFKANVRLFEQAAEKCTDTSPSADSKVKSNVKMFEEASSCERSVSLSPERLVPSRRKSRSPTSPRPAVGNFAFNKLSI